VIWKNALLCQKSCEHHNKKLSSQAEIQAGQETYLARGGQHIGIWGHGSLHWTADVLHRWFSHRWVL